MRVDCGFGKSQELYWLFEYSGMSFEVRFEDQQTRLIVDVYRERANS
jgi:hypothetical protein